MQTAGSGWRCACLLEACLSDPPVCPALCLCVPSCVPLGRCPCVEDCGGVGEGGGGGGAMKANPKRQPCAAEDQTAVGADVEREGTYALFGVDGHGPVQMQKGRVRDGGLLGAIDPDLRVGGTGGCTASSGGGSRLSSAPDPNPHGVGWMDGWMDEGKRFGGHIPTTETLRL